MANGLLRTLARAMARARRVVGENKLWINMENHAIRALRESGQSAAEGLWANYRTNTTRLAEQAFIEAGSNRFLIGEELLRVGDALKGRGRTLVDRVHSVESIRLLRSLEETAEEIGRADAAVKMAVVLEPTVNRAAMVRRVAGADAAIFESTANLSMMSEEALGAGNVNRITEMGNTSADMLGAMVRDMAAIPGFDVARGLGEFMARAEQRFRRFGTVSAPAVPAVTLGAALEARRRLSQPAAPDR